MRSPRLAMCAAIFKLSGLYWFWRSELGLLISPQHNANKPKKRLSVHVWYTVITPRPVRETNTLQWYHSIKMPPGGHRRHHHSGARFKRDPGRPDRFHLRVPDLREGRVDTTIWQCTEMTAPATAAERLTCHVRSILGRYKFREHISVKFGTCHCPDL